MSVSYHTVMTYEVKFQDCDPAGHIHLDRLMDYAQDCDDRNCLLLGVSGPSLFAKNACWIVIGHRLTFQADLPRAGDLLVVDSWSRGIDGIRFYRDNLYYLGRPDENNLIGRATSEWILTSADQHRPLRPASVLDLDDLLAKSDPTPAGAGDLARLEPLPDPVTAPSRLNYRVGYGDLDFNSHLHNTHYSRLAIDATAHLMGLDPLRQALLVRDLQVHYKAEVGFGEQLLLAAAPDPGEPDSVLVRGDMAESGALSFLAKLRCDRTARHREER